MKELKKWLWVWWLVLSFILGFPTLGLTWCLRYGWEFTDDPWGLRLIVALEAWVHGLRKLGLILAGFPTLGFTWFLVNKYEEPFFWGLRQKYQTGEVKRK